MPDQVAIASYVNAHRGYEAIALIPLARLQSVARGNADLPGSIALTVNNVCLSDSAQATSVVELWCYWVNALEEIGQGGTSEFYYPTYQLHV